MFFSNPCGRLSIEAVQESTKILMNLIKLRTNNPPPYLTNSDSKITSIPGKSISWKYAFSRVTILKIARHHANQTGNTETLIGQWAEDMDMEDNKLQDKKS